MKAHAFSFRLLLVVLAGLVTTGISARAVNASAAPGTLQVQVIVPPSWQPMFESKVADAFSTHLSDVFRRRGFAGKIQEVSDYSVPSPGCTLLTITLIDWRMNRIGDIDCTFAASLQNDHAVRQLGIFNGMAFRWMNPTGRFGLADTFGDAAEQAVRTLYDAVVKSHLVAELSPPNTGQTK